MMPSEQTEHFENRTKELRETFHDTGIYDLLKKVSEISGTPLIFEITNPETVNHPRSFKNTVVSKSTAEVMPFEVLPGEETSESLATRFIKTADNYVGSYHHESRGNVVPERPSYEELESAFSKVLQQLSYKDFPELLEKFNEKCIESLEPIIPHIIMVHPNKTETGYIGKIVVDPQYHGTNQRDPMTNLEICTYRVLDL